MNKRVSEEEVLRVIEDLKGSILIVEGRKDELALKGLGLENILKINSRPLLEAAQDAVSLAEKHKNRQIIILTDFDRKGRMLAAKIRPLLQRHKIHANSRVRRDVMDLGINRIEELASLRVPAFGESVSIKSRKERDDYGEISANFNKVRDKGLHKGKRCYRKAGCDRGYIRAD